MSPGLRMWALGSFLLIGSFAVAMTIRRFRKWVRETKFAESVMLLFTGALTIATFAQFSLLHGQLDVMRLDQRAWVTGVPGTPETPKSGTGELLRIPVKITNTGKTAAREVTVKLIASISKNGNDPSCDYAGAISRTTSTRIFLPNASRTIYAEILSESGKAPAQPRLIPADEIRQLADGEEFFIVYGEIRYRDIFDYQHWVHFCSHGTLSPTAVLITSSNCARYNDVDDD
jgi:hypothetical protein